jgi:hypothetical protein
MATSKMTEDLLYRTSSAEEDRDIKVTGCSLIDRAKGTSKRYFPLVPGHILSGAHLQTYQSFIHYPTSHHTRACSRECTRRGSYDGSHWISQEGPLRPRVPTSTSHHTRACAHGCTRRDSCDGSHCCTPLPVRRSTKRAIWTLKDLLMIQRGWV